MSIYFFKLRRKQAFGGSIASMIYFLKVCGSFRLFLIFFFILCPVICFRFLNVCITFQSFTIRYLNIFSYTLFYIFTILYAYFQFCFMKKSTILVIGINIPIKVYPYVYIPMLRKIHQHKASHQDPSKLTHFNTSIFTRIVQAILVKIPVLKCVTLIGFQNLA